MMEEQKKKKKGLTGRVAEIVGWFIRFGVGGWQFSVSGTGTIDLRTQCQSISIITVNR